MEAHGPCADVGSCGRSVHGSLGNRFSGPRYGPPQIWIVQLQVFSAKRQRTCLERLRANYHGPALTLTINISRSRLRGQICRERASDRRSRARRAEGRLPGVTVGVGVQRQLRPSPKALTPGPHPRPSPPALTPGPSPASGRGERCATFTLTAGPGRGAWAFRGAGGISLFGLSPEWLGGYRTDLVRVPALLWCELAAMGFTVTAGNFPSC